MATRREFLYGGFGALAWGLTGRPDWAAFVRPQDCAPTGAGPLASSDPVRHLPLHPDSVVIDGLPFADWFTGDDFTQKTIEFHLTRDYFDGGGPPAPTEEHDVVVVGGGISGLSAAFLLRRHRPVVLELHDRFGGAAQGERWAGTSMSLGGAYVITPDPGSFLHRFYRRLGLHRVRRESWPPDPIELAGVIHDDFWSGEGRPPEEQAAFQRYAEVVTYMAEESYPEIPVPAGPEGDWVRELDRKDFRQDLEERMGMPMPPLLAAAVQGYFYSSFGAGMQEISAASGWNFLAAEEFGRWVFPGGNAYMARMLWRKLARSERHTPPHCPARFLRANCTVIDVRLTGDRVQVTYIDQQRALHSLLARQVVIATPKHVAKRYLYDLETIDPDKSAAMQQVGTSAYVVVNVLLDAPIEREFYDVFLVGDETFPMTPHELANRSEVVDMLNGHYARAAPLPRSVLTLYWPLPWPAARLYLLPDGSFQQYAEAVAPQVREMLGLLDVSAQAVRQIRITRWGHALPIARPGFIAEGYAEHLLRPIDGRIWFVNQDNWALPAVENCLLDAEWVTGQIHARL